MVDDTPVAEAFEIVTEDIQFDSFEEDGENLAGEDVVKTTLPYDFFEENSSLEFVEDDLEETDDDIETTEDTDAFVSGFSVNATDFDFSNEFADDSDDTQIEEVAEKVIDNTVENADIQVTAEAETEADEREYDDIPISKGFSVDADEVDVSMFEEETDNSSILDSIEKIDDDKFSIAFDEDDEDDEDDDDEENDDDDDSESKHKFGFFRRKK